MLEEYIYRGKEKLRCGYTTGSCATAAAKACAIMLFSRKKITEVFIPTPKGIDLYLNPVDIEITNDYVKCGIVKDSGDDPDITKGITVYAKVWLDLNSRRDEINKQNYVEKNKRWISIFGGQGIGVVTKKGLDQPVGNPAINSTPREMIRQNLLEVMEEQDYFGGINVEISIPMGEELAKKTFNKKLGIEGGLSIIGTTGIVEPMSNLALIETIRIEENILKEAGRKNILCTLGNYGKTFLADTMPDILDKCVTCSNFIGEALDIGIEYDFDSILIVGHVGKMVKLGAGIMNTHSSNADGRMEVLITCGVLAGIEGEILAKLNDSVTVDDALSIVMEHPLYDKMINILMVRIENYLNLKVKNDIEVGAIIFSNKYGIIGKTSLADKLRDRILEEANG